MLDILINHYRESEELIGRLLQSIQCQNAIDLLSDIKVYIISDGEDNILSQDFLRQFSFSIHYSVKSHSGVCHTRNVLLDTSDSEYVMFCDADDVFSDTNGLYILLKSIRESGSDVIGSVYLAETMRNEKLKAIRLQRDTLRLHGKAFRRSYLTENDIRFPDEMDHGGDMYFLWLCYHLTGKIVWLSDCFYTWKWNKGSVTRSSEDYTVKNYPNMVKCYSLLTENLIQRQRYDLLMNLVSSCILTFYVDIHSKQLVESPQVYFAAAYKAISEYVCNYRQYYNGLPTSYLKSKYAGVLFSKGVRGPEEGLSGCEAWMDYIVQ